MIAEITGICQRCRAGSVVVNVQGLGLAIAVPPKLSDSLTVGQECTLFTKLIVRENEMSLVGFATASERDLFNTLLSAPGVGSKLALSILTKMTPGAFVNAMLSKDLAALVKVPGLGKRTAQKLLLEMETKIAKISQELPPEPLTTGSQVNAEAKAVLMSLGCSDEEAEQALQAAQERVGRGAEVSDWVMAAMQALS